MSGEAKAEAKAEGWVGLVGVDELQAHPQNPRKGNVAAIVESIRTNGWHGVVVAQQSTRRVLAGWHRLQAAREAGLLEVPVEWRDVDDDTALRIVLADNATSDRAEYDRGALREILEGLEDLAGTGYDDEWLARVVSVGEAAGSAVAGEGAEKATNENGGAGRADGPGEGEKGDEEPDGGDEEGYEDVPDDRYSPSWGVMVVCTSEAHQKEVYESLSAEGYDLRVVAV